MKLETNPNHKRADISKLDLLKRKLKASLIGTTIALSLFSGSIETEAKNENEIAQEQSIEDTKRAEIPTYYSDTIGNYLGKDQLSTEDLKSIKEITDWPIMVRDNESLSWLNNCESLEKISFGLYNLEDTSMFQDVKELPNLKSINFNSLIESEYTISKEDFDFLTKSKNLETIDLACANVEEGFIESITNLKTLKVSSEMPNLKFDYKKLTFLENLEFTGEDPYNVATNLTMDEYNTLVENGVNVTFASEEIKNKFLEVNQELDNIVKSLDVTKDSSDQEKLDAILIYTLEHLTYDEEVSEKLGTGENIDELTRSFYKGGNLYGALEKDSAICGNYAALVQALASRLDLNTEYLISHTHSWNLVEIEGQQYYVDATWLESQTETDPVTTKEGNMIIMRYNKINAEEKIKEGETDEIKWYMEDPTEIETLDSSGQHDALNISSTITIKPIEEVSNIVPEEQETKKDTTNKKFEISVGPKTFVIAGGALIGIALGLGGAVAISKNKNKHHRPKKENVEITPPKYTDSLDEFGFFDTNGNISPVNESKEQTPQQGIVDDPFDFFRDTTSEKRENNTNNQSPRRH